MPKKKGQVEIPGITRQDGELAIEFVDFLAEWETIHNKEGSIYLAASDYCLKKKFSVQKVDRFYNLLHMYVHKILRHRKFLDENLGEPK